jgi:hypothetical protein
MSNLQLKNLFSVCDANQHLKNTNGAQRAGNSVANLVSRLNQLNQNQALESNLNFIKIPITSYFSDSYLILQLLTHLGLVQLIKLESFASLREAKQTERGEKNSLFKGFIGVSLVNSALCGFEKMRDKQDNQINGPVFNLISPYKGCPNGQQIDKNIESINKTLFLREKF